MTQGILRASVLTVILVGVLSGPVFAQEDAGEPSAGAAGPVFDHFVVAGGTITWFILIPLSVATVALIIEHCVSIRRATLLPDETTGVLSDHLEKKEYVEAVHYVSEDRSMLGYVMHTAMAEASGGFAAMARAVEEAVDERAARLLRKIEYLNIIGSVSPMIGLFGTVYGMIRLFADIREAGGIPEPSLIAEDISIALVTTFWGLLVAIPALSVFALFRNRIDVLAAECVLTSERLLAVLKPEQVGVREASRRPASDRKVPPSAAASEQESADPNTTD